MVLTAAPHRIAPAAPLRPARSRVPLLVVALTVLAAVLRLYRLRWGYAHGTVDYDSGVYLGSSLALVDGHLPYRDFVFVQPPVITLLLTPLALLAKVTGTAQAMGLAKVATALAGAASVPLTARLVRHRGPLTVLVAAGFVAFQGDAVAASYSVLLEPWVVLFCLLGAVLVFDGDGLATDRRLLLGGVLLGLACATKIWAVAPLAAMVLAAVPLRRARRVLAGAGLGFAVPVAPFLLAAPGAFVHQVFVVQVLRSAPERTPLWLRLVHLFGVASPDGSRPAAALPVLVGGAVLFVVLAAAVWLRVRRPSPLERFAAAAAVLAVGLLLVPQTFYWHYAAFATPFVALAAALPLRRLGRARPVWALLAGGLVAVFAVTMLLRDLRGYHVHDDAAQVAAAVPPGACLVSSTPSASIAADRFALPAGCPVVVDPFGTVLDLTGGQSPSAAALRDPAVRAAWLGYLERADYLYLQQSTSPTIPSDAAISTYLREHFHRVPGVAHLYARN